MADFDNPKKFIRCCQCGNRYNIEGNLYKDNILVCPFCGLQHKVDFTLVEKQPVSYKLETINLAQDGSAENPWQVSSAADLQNVGYAHADSSGWADGLDDNGEATDKYNSWAMDDYYIQTADIDLDSGTLTPIGYKGSSYVGFAGQYDGNGYKIHNGSISENGNYVGLFARTAAGTLKNITMDDVDVTGGYYTGGIVGFNGSASTIENCCTTGDITTNQGWAGGITGTNYGTISSCYATGAISGSLKKYIGGLVGENYNGTIQNCYATGDVSGNQYIGGLAGNVYNGTISYCYATGTPTGSDSGGLVGSSGGTPTDTENYWDTDTSGTATSAMGTGLTTANMQKIASFTDAEDEDKNWDMVLIGDYVDEIWYIDDGNDYPRLGWEYEAPSGETHSVSGSSDSVLSTSSSINITWDLSGSTDSVLSTSANLNIIFNITGSSNSVLTTSSTIDLGVIKLTGSSNSVLTTLSTLNTILSLTGSSDNTLSTSAALNLIYSLSGSSSSSLDTSALLNAIFSLSGSSNSVLDTIATELIVAAFKKLTGSADSAISTLADLGVIEGLSGTVTCVIDTSGVLTRIRVWFPVDDVGGSWVQVSDTDGNWTQVRRPRW